MEYSISYNVGKAKYLVNYCTGKKHNDGSKFFDIAIFKNKKKMKQFINSLNKLALRHKVGERGYYEEAREINKWFKWC